MPRAVLITLHEITHLITTIAWDRILTGEDSVLTLKVPPLLQKRYHKIDNHNTVCSVPSLGKSEKTFQRK